MSAKCMNSILPPATAAESLEIAKILSVSGRAKANLPKILPRPFIAPHHTASVSSFTGGGSVPSPGVLSFAHRGILFLDELPLFHRDVLELLREPLSEHQITIARAGGNYTYPADFLLVAAMNPCPCGYYPDRNRCHCSVNEIRRYLGRVSGPILDRIDMHIPVTALEYSAIRQKENTKDSALLFKQVMEARKIQEQRYEGTGYRFNADLKRDGLDKFCALNGEVKDLMESVFENLGLSMRSHDKILRVSRTIADLAGHEEILCEDLLEAAGYQNEELWEVRGNE